jgi:hypothetical protein
MRPQILEVEVIAQHRARGRADDDLVRLRKRLQTCRQVRGPADDRGFRCRSFADLIADDHRSRSDADPHREFDPGRPRDRSIQLRHGIHDIETRPRRSLGLVLMGARVAEIRQDAVAHELRDKAVVAPDRSAAPVLERRDDIAQIFGIHLGGERSRPRQVAKHYRQLSALGLCLRWCGRRHRCWCHRQSWGWRGGAERSDGGKELATMADQGNAEADQVLSRQVRQDVSVDLVVAERWHVALKAQIPQPRRYVHAVILDSEEPQPLSDNDRTLPFELPV